MVAVCRGRVVGGTAGPADAADGVLAALIGQVPSLDGREPGLNQEHDERDRKDAPRWPARRRTVMAMWPAHARHPHYARHESLGKSNFGRGSPPRRRWLFRMARGFCLLD